MDTQTPPPIMQSSKKSSGALLFTIINVAIAIIVITSFVIIYNYNKIFPKPAAARVIVPITYERSLVGLPPYGDTFEVEGHPFFANYFTVETKDKLSDEQATQLEKAVDGTFCGGSPYSNVYFLCLHLSLKDEAEFKEKTQILTKFEFVTGVSPSSAEGVEAT